MTTTHPTASNPFVLMIEPEIIFAAMANSDRLARLESRICRPLDKPSTAREEDTAKASDDAMENDIEKSSDTSF